MKYRISENGIDGARTFFSNISEPQTIAEWDKFDKQLFHETVGDISDISVTGNMDPSLVVLCYLHRVLTRSSTMGQAYEVLAALEEKIAEKKRTKRYGIVIEVA